MNAPVVTNLGHADFILGNATTTWSIINAQVKCDLVTLDSGLNESYIKLLEEGTQLTLNYNTFISQYQTITGQTDFAINIMRSLTRLKYVFVSLWKDYTAAPRNTIVGTKQWNDFFSPSSYDTVAVAS